MVKKPRQQQPVPTETMQPQHAENNNLEAMLGTLDKDMSRQGIMTVPKGHCAACTKPIVGQVGGVYDNIIQWNLALRPSRE